MKPYYSDSAVTLYHGDCREILPALAVADHVITDPPYDAKTHAGARTSTRDDVKALGIDFDPIDAGVICPVLLASAKRWVVAFCALEQVGAYRDAAGASWVRSGTWHRVGGTPQFTGDRPAQGCEGIAIMHAPGRKRWNGGGKQGHYVCNIERMERQHPTQKPEPLMLALVLDFTDAGDLICDPFAGSGTTLAVAKRLGRRAVGIELDERYAEVAAKRLARTTLAAQTSMAEMFQ